MRGLRRRIAGGSHVPDHVPALHGHPFGQSGRVALQMGVLVAEDTLAVELVNRDAPRLAKKELLDDAVLHCNHRRSPRRQNICSLMQFSLSPVLREGVPDIACLQAPNWQSQLAPGEHLIVIACRGIDRRRIQKQPESTDRE